MRADDAQPLRQRLSTLAEQHGVIRGIAHDLLDVIAGLAERDGLGVNGAFERPVGAPSARAARPGVVGGGSQYRVIIEVFEHHAHVAGAQQQVGVGIVDLVGAVIAQTDFPGDPARRRRH